MGSKADLVRRALDVGGARSRRGLARGVRLAAEADLVRRALDVGRGARRR
jgi:hypothetical protein